MQRQSTACMTSVTLSDNRLASASHKACSVRLLPAFPIRGVECCFMPRTGWPGGPFYRLQYPSDLIRPL